MVLNHRKIATLLALICSLCSCGQLLSEEDVADADEAVAKENARAQADQLKPAFNPLQQLIQNLFQPRNRVAPPAAMRANARNRRGNFKPDDANGEEQAVRVNPSDRDYIDSRAPHDAKIEHQLKLAQTAIQRKDWKQAGTLLQQLLDLPEDSLHRLPDGRWQSVRITASAELGRAPADVLQSYQQQYGGLAKQIFDDAQAEGDITGVIRAATRFFHTDAGFQAAQQLAMVHRDRAEFGVAAQWLDQLRASRASFTQQPGWRVQAAAIYRQAGRDDAAKKLLDGVETAETSIRIGGQPGDFSAWLASLPVFSTAKPSVLTDWMQLAGTSDRTGLLAGSAPFLMSEWHVPYSSSHGVRQRVKWLMQDLADQDRPLLLAAQPLAIDGKAIYRDLRGVHVVDVATGDSLWESIEGMSAERIAGGMTNDGDEDHEIAFQFANGMGDPFGGHQAEQHPLVSFLLRDAAYNTISSDGRQVFLIEDQGILTRQNSGWQGGGGDEQVDPYGFSWSTNRIASYDLLTGRPLWTVGGPETAEAFQLPLAGVYFHGVPTPDGDELFAIGSKGDELRLWCLDRRTGGLRWSQLIGYADSRIDQDIVRRWMTALPSVSSGIVVCPTNLGWMVAVDRLRQTVQWAVRYSPPTTGNDPSPGNQFAQQRELGGQWGVGAPLIVGQKVIYAPVEDQVLVCVDLVTGAPAWQINRDQGQYVAGTTGEAVIVVELQQVCAYAVADGRKLWSHEFGEAGRPSGRGLMTAEMLFQPLSSGELRTLNLSDGKIAQQTFMPAGEAPLGNLLLHQGQMLSLNYHGLTGFRQQDALREDIRQRKVKNPHDPIALLNEAEIELLNRNAERALPLLRQIPPAELPEELAARRHRDLIGALTAAIRQNLAESEQPLSELAQIAASPTERLLHLDLSAERFLAAKQHQAAFEIFWKLSAETTDDLITRNDDLKVQVRHSAWLAGRLRDVWQAATDEERAKIDEQITSAFAANLDQPVAARRRLAELLAFHPQSRGPWRDLISQRIAAGETAQAELELQRWIESAEPAMAAWAWLQLAELMNQLKLPADAADGLARLEAEHAETVLPDGTTGAQAAKTLRDRGLVPSTTPTAAPLWDERPLKVVQSMFLYYGQQGQEIAPNSRLPLFESLNIEYLPQEQRLSFESRDGGDFRWLAPLRLSPVSHHNGYLPSAAIGHSLALVHLDVLHVLSPAQRQILWTLSLDGFSEGGLPPHHVGRPPLTPMWNLQQGGGWQSPLLQQSGMQGRLAVAQAGYLAVNGRRTLHVLDSLTGTELWRRTNVLPHARILGGPDILWIVPSDLQQIVGYRTQDGAPVAGDEWSKLFGHALGLAGNDLLLAEEGAGFKLLGLNRTKTVVRRYDPLLRRDLWKQEFGSGAMLSRLSDDELMVVPASGEVELVDIAHGKRQALAALTSKDLESRSDCYALADEDRVYLLVNSQNQGGYQHFAESLPSVRANGTMFAWERSTGKLLWKHTLTNQHLIVERLRSSPVLLFCAREWKQKANVNFSQLNLAVLHKQSGKLLHQSTTPTMYSGFHAMVVNPAEQSLELRSYNLKLKLVPDDSPPDKPATQGSN